MADLKKAFAQAQEDVKTLTKKPGMDDFAFLYSHFKQAEKGDVAGSRPGPQAIGALGAPIAAGQAGPTGHANAAAPDSAAPAAAPAYKRPY